MERRLRFLADASVMLASAVDTRETLQSLARMIVPTLADWCTITLRELDGTVRRIAGVHRDPACAQVIADYLERFDPAQHRSSAMADAVREGRSYFAPHVDKEWLAAAAQSEDHLRALETLGCTSTIVAPILARGVAIGAISMSISDDSRRFEELDHLLARELGALTGLAIDNARRATEREHLLDQAEAASRAKDEFFAILGHELRNPLAPIQTATELLRMRGGTPERELAVIERQTRHLTRLVDDLLDVARIARGGVDLSREPVDVAEIVRNATDMVEPLLVKHHHQLTMNIARGLVVDADPTRLAQILGNLLTNAASYTPPGGSIEVRAVRDGDRITIRVRDTGIGIPAEMLPNIFEPFVQQRQPLDRSRGGLGLGLAIVRSLVEAHGGSVRAHSEGPGHGTEVTVELPAAAAPARVESEPSAPAPAPRVDAPGVLVVDDNEDACALLAETLERAGYVVRTAGDAAEALAVCQSYMPSAALLDIGLPGMDGFELARRMRALPGFDRVFLVAVTGYGQDADRERTREAGFDEHLVKPVTMKQIRAVLAAGIDSSDIPARR
jgi:signal transduction histidine kinase/ActR/RegA family two-component response regulator